MSQHTEWCRVTFERIHHGGLWGIPRSGLVFRKTANTLLWVAVFPVPQRYRRAPEKVIARMREIEFAETALEFGNAGVPVLRASVIKSFNSLDEAKSYYGKGDVEAVIL